MKLKIQGHVESIDPLVQALVYMIRDKDAFVKNWANSAAMEGRENARRKGGRRFWRDLARSVTIKSMSADTWDVGSDHVAAAQKQFGGAITPVNRRALTIPVAPEAKGKTAYDFERSGRKLFVLKRGKGDPGTRGLLGHSKGKGKNAKFKALFVLRTRVFQNPDQWFPNMARLMALAGREADRQLDKEKGAWDR